MVILKTKMIALGMTVMLLAAGHPKCLKMKDKMSVAGKILKYWVLDGKKVADWLSKFFFCFSLTCKWQKKLGPIE